MKKSTWLLSSLLIIYLALAGCGPADMPVEVEVEEIPVEEESEAAEIEEEAPIEMEEMEIQVEVIEVDGAEIPVPPDLSSSETLAAAKTSCPYTFSAGGCSPSKVLAGGVRYSVSGEVKKGGKALEGTQVTAYAYAYKNVSGRKVPICIARSTTKVDGKGKYTVSFDVLSKYASSPYTGKIDVDLVSSPPADSVCLLYRVCTP